MGDSREGALAFLVEWSDPAAQVTRKFSLSFFPTDNSVEMVRLKSCDSGVAPGYIDFFIVRPQVTSALLEPHPLRDCHPKGFLPGKHRRGLLQETANKRSFLYFQPQCNSLDLLPFLTDYASESTKKRLESRRESTFAMLKPDGMKHLGSIYSRIEREGLTVAKAKLTKLEKSHAEFFYAEHSERSFFLSVLSRFIAPSSCHTNLPLVVT